MLLNETPDFLPNPHQEQFPSVVPQLLDICSVEFITLLATVFEADHTIVIAIKMVVSLDNCNLAPEYLILSFSI